jgi:hypothetical protein
VEVCDKNDNPLSLSNGASVQTSCASGGGNGYLCSDYSPRPVSEDLSYAFAVMNEARDCCKCFELQWTNGPAAGKRVQVQMINVGGDSTDITLVVPGGGVGPNTRGCEAQYGYDW